MPWGIEPSESDFLNAIESTKHNADSEILRESQFSHGGRSTLAQMRFHAFKTGIENEIHGKCPELKSKRVENARMLALTIEPCHFLFDVFKYLGEHEKCISVYDLHLAAPSKWSKLYFEQYLSIKKLIDPSFDIEKEREAILSGREALRIQWEKELDLVKTPTGLEAAIKNTQITLLVASLIASVYFFVKVHWLVALVFGFVSIKLLGFFDSIHFGINYRRVEKWKKDHPKPFDF